MAQFQPPAPFAATADSDDDTLQTPRKPFVDIIGEDATSVLRLGCYQATVESISDLQTNVIKFAVQKVGKLRSAVASKFADVDARVSTVHAVAHDTAGTVQVLSTTADTVVVENDGLKKQVKDLVVMVGELSNRPSTGDPGMASMVGEMRVENADFGLPP
jgi:hypothetical protein